MIQKNSVKQWVVKKSGEKTTSSTNIPSLTSKVGTINPVKWNDISVELIWLSYVKIKCVPLSLKLSNRIFRHGMGPLHLVNIMSTSAPSSFPFLNRPHSCTSFLKFFDSISFFCLFAPAPKFENARKADFNWKKENQTHVSDGLKITMVRWLVRGSKSRRAPISSRSPNPPPWSNSITVWLTDNL